MVPAWSNYHSAIKRPRCKHGAHTVKSCNCALMLDHGRLPDMWCNVGARMCKVGAIMLHRWCKVRHVAQHRGPESPLPSWSMVCWWDGGDGRVAGAPAATSGRQPAQWCKHDELCCSSNAAGQARPSPSWSMTNLLVPVLHVACLHQVCTNVALGAHHVCTIFAPVVHQVCTIIAPGWHRCAPILHHALHVCTKFAPCLHHICTRCAPSSHHYCTRLAQVCTHLAPCTSCLHQVCTMVAPYLHQVCTRSAPNLHQFAPNLHHGCTIFAPYLHQVCTSFGPSLHQVAPNLHHGCTIFVPSLYHVYTTFAQN